MDMVEPIMSPKSENLSQIIQEVQTSPALMKKLAEEVYQLMVEDLRRQRERIRNYGRRI